MPRFEETKNFTIHKPEKYDGRFIQADFSNLGKVMRDLSGVGKNLYFYLLANQNGFDFEVIVSNYSNWLGDSIYTAAGEKSKSKHDTYKKQIKNAIDDLVAHGYLVQRFPNVYDFYEVAQCSNAAMVEPEKPESDQVVCKQKSCPQIEVNENGFIF